HGRGVLSPHPRPPAPPPLGAGRHRPPDQPSRLDPVARGPHPPPSGGPLGASPTRKAHPMIDCRAKGCERIAVWAVYAAYPDGDGGVHPRLRRYPAPQGQVCHEHLAEVMATDAATPGSTQGWYVAPAGRPGVD